MKYLATIIFLFYFTSNSQIIFQHEMRVSEKLNCVSNEINIYNKEDNIMLSGTLLWPENPYNKIVIIVPGSGKDTRHAHHKITEALLLNNIAVYRFDERGVGKSQGVFTNSINSLKADLASCIQYFKRRYRDKSIGVLGHSLGGVAAILNSNLEPRKNISFDFLIQMAVPLNYSETCRYQLEQKSNKEFIEYSKTNILDLFDSLMNVVKENNKKGINLIKEKGNYLIQKRRIKLNAINFWSENHIKLYKTDFEKLYKSIKIPVIYVIGSDDNIVNSNNEIKHLSRYNNPSISYYKLKNLDHFLTRFRTNNESIYNIDKSATDTILSWLKRI